MDTNLQTLKTLREMTKAGMADCKKALLENDNNFELAVEWLRIKGMTKALVFNDREASEGSITSYIHTNGKVGVLLEVNCQTDFVANTDEFRQFCKDVALHIAGRDPFPIYVIEEEIPPAVVEKEIAFLKTKAKEDPKFEKKPLAIQERIIDGQMDKWVNEICLLDQEFIKDPTRTIRELMMELSGKTGEKISIRRFTRYSLGN